MQYERHWVKEQRTGDLQEGEGVNTGTVQEKGEGM